jgi:nickel/cobalt transporter (NicO) family protein
VTFDMPMIRRASAALLLLWLVAATGTAHPVAKDNHDRTIMVRLQKGGNADTIRVRVEYRLEVDEATVVYDDMKPFADEVSVLDYRGKALAYYAEFARLYAPVYAAHLVVHANGQPLELTTSPGTPRLKDEEGKELGHLRCDFLFATTFPLVPGKNTFELQEKNYYDQPGQIVLHLVNETGLELTDRWEPDEAFRKRVATQADPGDEDRLRTLRAALLPDAAPKRAAGFTPAEPPPAQESATPTPKHHNESFSLLRLFLHTDYGFWLLMLMACAYGGAHALTPGHGKTLVAAYLVGERGTIAHAMVLGVVTTLTHTGAVLVLAGVLFVLPEDRRHTFQSWIEQGLGLAMGLMVTAMGFWLLLQRLAGRADHIHIGAGHHHHHGEAAREQRLGWWGVIWLGIAGGLIPCGDAVVLLLYTTGQGQLTLVLPALLAFSFGLAGVLVLIGILVVQVPRFARAHGGEGRLLRSLPILSALFITAMGLWLCYDGTHQP